MRYIVILIAIIFCSASFSVAQTEEKTTRILFIFDASLSMFGHFGGKPKIDIAQKTLSEALDSLKNVPNLEFALRVYGNRSKLTQNNQDCEDTHLEVPFDDDNIEDIKHVLKQTTPTGTTPIAKSLEETINDFPPCSNCKNVIILITDGIEACDGDPCAVARALRKNDIFLKPFVIGLGVLEDYKKHFYCIGNYYDAKDQETFKNVLQMVIQEALSNTTCEVDLLDVTGKPLETNVNMTFYNHENQEIKYNYIHTMNYKNLPDTLTIDPSIKYDITVHTIPPVTKENVQLIPGQHNTIPIETPQGELVFDIAGGTNQVKNINSIIYLPQSCEPINFQSLNEKDKYLVGTYDIKILTTPPIYTSFEISQSKTTKLAVPQPGLASVKFSYKGIASLYLINGKDQIFVKNLDQELNSQSIELLPGNYRIVFRSLNANRAFYTEEEDFIINPGKSTIVNF